MLRYMMSRVAPSRDRCVVFMVTRPFEGLSIFICRYLKGPTFVTLFIIFTALARVVSVVLRSRALVPAEAIVSTLLILINL